MHYQLKIGIVPLSKTAHEYQEIIFKSGWEDEWFRKQRFLPESLNYYNDLDRLSIIAEKNKDKIPEVLQLNRIIIKNENREFNNKEGIKTGGQ